MLAFKWQAKSKIKINIEINIKCEQNKDFKYYQRKLELMYDRRVKNNLSLWRTHR